MILCTSGITDGSVTGAIHVSLVMLISTTQNVLCNGVLYIVFV